MTCRLIACLLLAGIGALGQTLRMTPVSGAPGESIAVRILLDAPPEQSPATLQWEVVFPAQILEVSTPVADAGAAAQSSGKFLTCVERNSYTQVCILTGGKKPIANGAIATVHWKIRASAKAGTTSIKVTKAQGVTTDLRQLDVKDANTVVTIQ